MKYALFEWLGEKDSNLRNGSRNPNPLLYNYLILLNNFAYIKLAYVKIPPLAISGFHVLIFPSIPYESK